MARAVLWLRAMIATAPATVDSPPAILPAEHFAAALLFFALGSVGLVVVAPELAAGSFFLPRVVAVVHLFVLGFILLSIYGALCQFLPVAVGVPMRWLPLAHATFAAQLMGLFGFVGGLLVPDRGLLLSGATLLTFALVGFAANLLATLASARDRSLTWWALAGASLFLALTPIFGFLLALNLHGHVSLADRFGMVAVHAHVALVGFVLLVMVGVAHRLLPMFLLSHGASERPARVAVVLLISGATLLSLPLGEGRFAVAGVLVAGGVVAFFLQALLFFRHRKRRAIDPGMGLAGAGVLGLVTTLLLAPLALTKGVGELRLLTTYFVLLLGSIALFVAGHYYKIVPFLVWFHRFGPLVGKQKVPNVAELWPQKAALASGFCLVGGSLCLALSVWLGSVGGVRAGASLFAVGSVSEVAIIVRVSARRPK